MKGSHDEPGLKAETSNDKAEEIHRASRRGGLENYSCPEEVSRNDTGLLEETYHARIHEWCSCTIHNTDHQNASNLDITTSQLGRKGSDRESILDDEYEKMSLYIIFFSDFRGAFVVIFEANYFSFCD